MNSRDLTKRIELFAITSVSDGFGGFTVSSASLGKSWAKIESIQPGRSNNLDEFGITDLNKSIFVTVRKRNDLVYSMETMFFTYRGSKYTISTAPTNVDFNDRWIKFTGAIETTKSNEVET